MVIKKKSNSKKVSKKIIRKKNSTSNISNDFKEIEREIKQFENWTYQRRKFLIKAGLVFGAIILILILDHFY